MAMTNENQCVAEEVQVKEENRTNTSTTVQAVVPARTRSFHGSGLAILRSHSAPGGLLACTFSHLYFSFPLKLITPRTSNRNASLSNQDCAVAALYIVGYGGGLVSGDSVDLDIDVGEQCTMLLLTQGSTKVFKMRTSTADALTQPMTRQNIRCIIQPNSTLLLLPSAVTCYKSSKYTQIQRFDLKSSTTSNLILLDWITPGREYSLDKKEKWHFHSYYSRNEICINGKVIIRDVLLLEDDVNKRTHPYSIYANLFIVGCKVQNLIERFKEEFRMIQQRLSRHVPGFIWSFSELSANQPVAVVRIAGMETEQVRDWLRERLEGVEQFVGQDLYKQAMW
ncbi:unnamed protein product [Sympodiomycopsis kandeliae]